MRAAFLPVIALSLTSAAYCQDKLPDNFPRPGEVKLHGRIILAPADGRSVLLRADSLLLPNGRTATLEPNRDKLVLLTPQTGYTTGGKPGFTVGQEISALGPSTGKGKPLTARYIVCGGAYAKAAPLEEPANVTVERLPEGNAQIVAFCRARIGQKVGDGQCTALAEAALRQAGMARRYAEFPGEGDYVWGRRVYYLEVGNGSFAEQGGAPQDAPVLPGDVIQFRDAVFRGRTASGSYVVVTPHHTAIVAAVADQGRTLTVYEQNSNGQATVIESTLHLSDLKQGWLRVYRPRRAE